MTTKSAKQPRSRSRNRNHPSKAVNVTGNSPARQMAHDAIGTFAIVTIVFAAISLLSWATTTTRPAAPAAPIHYDFIER